MRTSRMARDASRMMQALSQNGGETRARRSSRKTASSSISSNGVAKTESIQPRKRRRLSDAEDGSNTVTLEGTTQLPRTSPRKAIKLEAEETPPSRKAKRQPAKRIKGPDGETKTEPPPNWEEVYNVTTAMRKRRLAAVDTMGCESLAEETRSPIDRRLQTLIALMLSSQTKDTVTAVAMKTLQEQLPGGFCLESLIKIDPVLLNQLIIKVGFHNNKTKYIKQTAEILRDRFAGDIPDTIDGLVSLPGVGPKMAYLTMSAAWGRDEGIGVDVHVHRITNLWGWHKTSTPEQTRAELEAWLPRDKWHDINHLLVGFGQTYCPPLGRKCEECDLATRKLCPSAVLGSPTKRRVKKQIEMSLEDGAIEASSAKIEQDDVDIKVEIEDAEMGFVELNGQADLKDAENESKHVI